MRLGVGGVVKLAAEEPTVLFGKLRCLFDHTASLAGGGRQNDFRSKEPEEPPALQAETLRHDDDQRIAFLRAHHREPDTCVAARRLDDGLAGLQPAIALRCLDDADARCGP